MGKAFVEGDIVIDTKDPKYGVINWAYHVAPMALVKDSKGKVKKMVFDPSLFNRPVTVEDWTAKMKENPESKVEKPYFGGRFQVGPADIRPNKANAWVKGTKEDNKEMLAVLKQTSDLGDPSHFYDYLYKKAYKEASKKAAERAAAQKGAR
ncbi:protein-glutamine glutaminase family protein [Bdellovibrio sp. HCB209]|uniref:protein-glutamine glutaminase family protein n=1 Tax=Bdellovibrio sp. HCB209 TaxID=3394354 RepID=UPI0039B3AA15